MKRIFKYSIPLQGEFDKDLPIGAEILSFQSQNDLPYIWVIIDEDADVEKRRFRIYGTGHPIERTVNEDISLHFIGTIQILAGGLVWHLFEVKNE